MIVKFDGFHGTDNDNVDSILQDGFKISSGDKDWLGDGCYFFVEGINKNPCEQAVQWAILNAWDNKNRKNKYVTYAVLHSNITVDDSKFLDLTNADGVEILDYIQKLCREKLATIGKGIHFIDGYLINFARTEKIIDIEVTKGNVYIKLNIEDRIHNLRRRINNCTICSVYLPSNNIGKNIKLVKKGNVEYEIG